MCGRINLRMSAAELAAGFELFREPDWPGPRYNLGPMQTALAIRLKPDRRVGDGMQWGLVPSWAKDSKIGSQTFNARAETVATKPAFRSAFKQRRCLIPASGFYEWQKLDAKIKQPWNIFRADGQPLAFAGLWEQWSTPDGKTLESFTIITTQANSFMAQIHDRMPVILDKSTWNLWLDPGDVPAEALSELLIPCPSEWLEKYQVSSIVGNVRNESPECVKPIDVRTRLF